MSNLDIIDPTSVYILSKSNYPKNTWDTINIKRDLIKHISKDSYWNEFFNLIKKSDNNEKSIWDSTIEKLINEIKILKKDTSVDDEEEEEDDKDEEDEEEKDEEEEEDDKEKKDNSKINIFPPPNLIFTSFITTDPRKIKVVIIGQNPYPNKNAMGIPFSVPYGNEIPSSLKNIYNRVRKSGYILNSFKKNNYLEINSLLTTWTALGIFPININFTIGNNKTHNNIWKDFTNELILYLTKNRTRLVYIVWGIAAHELLYKKVDPLKNKIITTSHPDDKNKKKTIIGFDYINNNKVIYPAFDDVDFCKLTNNHLVELGYNDDNLINWNILL